MDPKNVEIRTQKHFWPWVEHAVSFCVRIMDLKIGPISMQN